MGRMRDCYQLHLFSSPSSFDGTPLKRVINVFSFSYFPPEGLTAFKNSASTKKATERAPEKWVSKAKSGVS